MINNGFSEHRTGHHGGLDWARVRPLIEATVAKLPDVDVTVYEPTDRYQPKPKASGVETLTPPPKLPQGGET